jgi:hypothetical protein
MRLAIALSLSASLLAIACGDDAAPIDASTFDVPVEHPNDAVAPGTDGAPVGAADANDDWRAEGDVPFGAGSADAPTVDAAASGQDGLPNGPAAPPECRVGPVPTMPYVVDFQFRNEGGLYKQDVFVETQCYGAAIRISSCASGYTDDLFPHCRCVCPRNPSSTCMGTCQACLPPHFELRAPSTIGGGRTWIAEEMMGDAASEPLMCPRVRLLPAGVYRMTVQVRDGSSLAPIRTITRTFEITGPYTRVPIELNPRHDSGADGGAEAGGG